MPHSTAPTVYGFIYDKGVCKRVLPLSGFNAAISSTNYGYFSQPRVWTSMQTQPSQYPFDGNNYDPITATYTVTNPGYYLMAASIG